MIYNIHNENDWRQSVPCTCMCNVDISRTIPTTLFLKTKYLKYHKISFKFRAITNLSFVPLNPWLIPRINIQKSNLYRNGFIVKKLIYWSEHTHNRPGWSSKSQSQYCVLSYALIITYSVLSSVLVITYCVLSSVLIITYSVLSYVIIITHSVLPSVLIITYNVLLSVLIITYSDIIVCSYCNIHCIIVCTYYNIQCIIACITYSVLSSA